jgi:hypothetical protein
MLRKPPHPDINYRSIQLVLSAFIGGSLLPETKAFVQSPFPMLISSFNFAVDGPKKRTNGQNKPTNS